MVILFVFIITVIEIYSINSFLLHGGTCDVEIYYILLHGGTYDVEIYSINSFLLHGGTCEWCVLLYINTNESTLMCTIIYQSTHFLSLCPCV